MEKKKNERKQKKLEDLSIIELKSIMFDLDQQTKQIQANMQTVAQQLQKKIEEGKKNE